MTLKPLFDKVVVKKHEEKEIHRLPVDRKPDGDWNRLHDSGNRNLLWHCPDRAKVICGKDNNPACDANRSARELPDRSGCGNGRDRQLRFVAGHPAG